MEEFVLQCVEACRRQYSKKVTIPWIYIFTLQHYISDHRLISFLWVKFIQVVFIQIYYAHDSLPSDIAKDREKAIDSSSRLHVLYYYIIIIIRIHFVLISGACRLAVFAGSKDSCSPRCCFCSFCFM